MILNDIDKFKRHMRQPVDIVLKNKDGVEDTFKMMPLTNEDLIDFMVVSSYGDSMESSREVRINKDLEEDIRDKNVIIIEDIIAIAP